jgi:hypothetical protein
MPPLRGRRFVRLGQQSTCGDLCFCSTKALVAYACATDALPLATIAAPLLRFVALPPIKCVPSSATQTRITELIALSVHCFLTSEMYRRTSIGSP